MDLMSAAWMVRELGQPVSALHLGEDGSIIAGGWDGIVKSWDGEGTTLWQVECGDRVGAILVVNDLTFLTSGLDVVCIENEKISWTHALEGSADMLCLHQGNVIATSSVYDIEHGDFMESAIWRFAFDGELISVDRMDERPWFVESNDSLLLGLGRPRCGILLDEKHIELATESPVTCGLTGRSRTILGHADGTISQSDGELVSVEEATVDSIICAEYGFVSALENGNLIARNADASPLWSATGSTITCQTEGFDQTHWVGRWQTISGILEVRDSSGDIITKMETSKPRVAVNESDRVGFGFDDGQILIWDKELFLRRKSAEKPAANSANSALAARLRSLRK